MTDAIEPGLGGAAFRRRRGFTIVELMMVAILAAIVAALAAPRYANSLARYRADIAARRIAADLNYAQTRARAASAGQSILFNAAAGTYTLPGVTDLVTKVAGYTVNLRAEPYAATLKTVDFGGKAQADFDGFGAPLSGGTIVVVSGNAEKSVVLDAATGRASVP